MSIRKKNNVRPNVRIFVAERQSSVSRGIICRDEIDIQYRPSVLLALFFRKPTQRILDLLRVVACVAHADRRVTRRHSICWERDIELDIPVSDPEFWSDEVEPKFKRVLNLVSGDSWSFNFRKPKVEIEIRGEGYLEFPANGELVTAYSNGLDSFAVARLVASGEANLSNGTAGKKNLVLVTTGQQIHLGEIYTQFGYSVRQVSVPFTIPKFGKGFQLRESSYRTRALVFQTIAALAAKQSQSNTVIVGEGGQGSLGPWFTVTGQESADVRTHPFFTAALSDFLEVVLGSKIQFEHPLIWSTKGQTLKRLVDCNLQAGWQETHSCAVQVRHQKTGGRRLHCGLCPNCLLRRQSLLAAGLDDPDSNYDYSCVPEKHNSENSSDADHLRKRVAQGIMPMIEFARLRGTPLQSRVVDRQVEMLARSLHIDTAHASKRLDGLVAEHKTELLDFIYHRSARSFLRKIGEVLL